MTDWMEWKNTEMIKGASSYAQAFKALSPKTQREAGEAFALAAQGKPAGTGGEPLPAPSKKVKSPAAIRYHKLFDAALDYAERGWHVLPVGADKQPLIAGGVNSATKDPEKIAGWPKDLAGVAIACGPSDLLVVDIDSPEALERWKAFAGENWKIHTPAIVRTRRGVHLYFKGAQKVPAHLKEGVDLKSEGGYVVCPPSVHASGHEYKWVSEGDPVPVPKLILAEIIRMQTASAQTGGGGSAGAPKDLKGGNRNLGLTRQAGALRRAGLSGPELQRTLLERNAALSEPLGEHEVLQIVRSITRDHQPTTDLPYHDSGNAERLMRRFGDVLRFCPEWNKWLFWNGQLWDAQRGRYSAQFLVEEISADIKVAGALAEPNKVQNAILSAARALGRQAGIQNCLAATERRAWMAAEEFDSHNFLLGVANGTLDLKSGTLRTPNREDYITKQTRAGYFPAAICPLWEATLEKVLPDEDLRKYFQLAVGYTLTGSVQEQCYFFLYGDGANGKTTLVEALLWMFGAHGKKIGPDIFLSKRSRGAAPEIVELQNLRFAVASETGADQKLAEARLKNQTGGDTMSGRGLYAKEMTSFVSTHKLWVFGNHKPIITGTDEGIWRRIRLFEFGVKIPEADQDKDLLGKLKEESEGILAWAVRGCQRWLGEGLPEVEGISEAVSKYRAEDDNVAQWLAAECELGADYFAANKPLAASWKNWVFRTYEGKVPKGLSWRRTVPPRLRDSLCESDCMREGLMGWRGIRLRKHTAVGDDGEIRLFL